MLTLPLWIVTEHIKPTDPAHASQQEPGKALVFITIDKLVEFKRAR
jgi:hypothetical protein